MVDTNFAAAIARDAEPDDSTLLIEIGPGTGCLTGALLASHPNVRVLAMEIDRGLAALLRETFAEPIAQKRLTLIEGDALSSKHEISPELIKTALEISVAENRPRRVLCSNLPYNAATPLLANMAADASGLGMHSAIATVQLELAERLFAAAGDSDYGGLSALMSLRSDGKIIRRVGGEIFWPRPNVDSAVIKIVFKPWPKAPHAGGLSDPLSRDEAPAFQQFLQTLFSQRRKMIRSALKPKQIPESLGISGDARAETLTPEQLLALFRAIA